MPPSANALYRVAGKRLIKTTEYKRYLREFAQHVVDNTPNMHIVKDDFFRRDYPYEIEIGFNFDRIFRKRKSGSTVFLMLDLDNRLKALCDGLKVFMGIDDANYFNYKLAKRCFPGDQGNIKVRIRRMEIQELEEWPW